MLLLQVRCYKQKSHIQGGHTQTDGQHEGTCTHSGNCSRCKQRQMGTLKPRPHEIKQAQMSTNWEWVGLNKQQVVGAWMTDGGAQWGAGVHERWLGAWMTYRGAWWGAGVHEGAWTTDRRAWCGVGEHEWVLQSMRARRSQMTAGGAQQGLGCRQRWCHCHWCWHTVL